MNRQVHVIPQDQIEEVTLSESMSISESTLLSVAKSIVTKWASTYPVFHAIPLDKDQKFLGRHISVYNDDADNRHKTFVDVIENVSFYDQTLSNRYNDEICSFVYIVSTQYGFDVHDMRALTLVMKCLNSIPENVRISAFIVSTDIDFYICPSFTVLE